MTSENSAPLTIEEVVNLGEKQIIYRYGRREGDRRSPPPLEALAEFVETHWKGRFHLVPLVDINDISKSQEPEAAPTFTVGARVYAADKADPSSLVPRKFMEFEDDPSRVRWDVVTWIVDQNRLATGRR